MTALLRVGRSEEVEGILLLALSALVLSGTGGGDGLLGSVVGALVAAFGVGVFFPPLVLGLWGMRRFQHRRAFKSRRELAAWVALHPVVVAALEWIQPGAGGKVGFWLRAYLEVLLGSRGMAVGIVALLVVLLCDCLDVSPRHLFKGIGRVGDRVFLAPVRVGFGGVVGVLRAFQGVVYTLIKDLWVVIDVLSRRLEGAVREPALEGPALPAAPEILTDPAPEPEHTPEPEEILVVERGVAPAPVEKEGRDPLASARMARAMAVRRVDPVLPDQRAATPPPISEADAGWQPEEEPELDFEDEPGAEDAPGPRLRALSSAAEEAPAPRVRPAPAPAPPEEPEDADLAIERPMEGVPRPVIRAEEPLVTAIDETYELPPLRLLDSPPDDLPSESDQELRRKADLIVKTLGHFGIDSTIRRVTCGPAITQFELVPAAGVKVSRLTSLSDDLAMALAVARVRIEAPIPGRGAVGIEVPNKTTVPVFFQEIAAQLDFRDASGPLTFALGKGIAGNPVVSDLARAPHMLVAGATGAGKSVCINTIITSLLLRNRPDELKLLLIDPKMVELMIYDGVSHLVAPVITDPQAASSALKWAVLEMERRYRILSKAGYRNIATFNQKVRAGEVEIDDFELEGLGTGPAEPFPYLVVIIDELADLMMVAPKDIEDSICRLAQMARAVGIHLIVATQRPSTNVITGIIKANLPTRIAFRVASKVDSKVILDHMGAESLLGRGDMLYLPVGQPKATRIQGAFIGDDEIKRLVKHISGQVEPAYEDIVAEVKKTLEPTALDPAEVDDEYLPSCIRLAVEKGEVSTSMLQRHFKIGYNRAATIIEVMEHRGILSGAESGRRRKVLIGPGQVEDYC